MPDLSLVPDGRQSEVPVLLALSSAATGMRGAVRLLDGAAARVARDTARTADVAQGLPDPAPLPAGEPDDGLLGALPDLLTARTLMAANVFTARRADDAYRSALDLLA